MDGIHIHPHDVLDEGSETILRHLSKMKGIHYIFPQVNTIFERNPNPVGILPHNPNHDVVMGTGTFHANMNTKQISPMLYQQIDSTIERGEDPIWDFKIASQSTNYEIVPWFNILNGHFKGNLRDNAVYNIFGEKVEHWLCPNGQDVLNLWIQTIIEFIKKYKYKMIMIDRIRYPDWAGKTIDPFRMFSCFCNSCKTKMLQFEIDLTELENDIKQFIKKVQQKDYIEAVYQFKHSVMIGKWIEFRKNSISEFVQGLITSVQRFIPETTFLLDLWPPSYAWFLGQDYHQLTNVASSLKHFPYHKLGGGADVQGLIEILAKKESEYEEVFKAFLKFFEIDQSITYQTIKRKGYNIDFIIQENEKVRLLSQPGTTIYSGVQMWNINEKDFIDTIRNTRQSAADAIIYYCYGWADLSHFKMISEQMNH